MSASTRSNRNESAAHIGQPRLPRNITTLRQCHHALHDFAEQLHGELDGAVRDARARQLGAARSVEHLCRFLLRRERTKQPVGATGLDAPPTGFSFGPNLATSLRHVDLPALAARVTAWSAVIAALAGYEGTPFERKPLTINRRRIARGDDAVTQQDDEHKALEGLEREAQLLLAIFTDVAGTFEQRLCAGKTKRKAAAGGSFEKLTAPQAAKRLRVSADKVRAWINSGELSATNVAGNGAIRPRWRIDAGDLARFEKSRQPKKPAPTTRRRRRKNDVIGKEYF